MQRLIATTVLSTAAALAALVLPSAVLANPAYEPNDGIHQAFGPLQAGTNYDATISSNNDVDWYILYVSGQGVLDVAVTDIVDPDEGCCSPFFELRDANGSLLNSSSADENETEHITYTTPGPGAYYVEVNAGANDRYRLSVTGPLTNGPRPGPPEETVPNNNPDITSAFGPLLGGRLYGGSIDAVDEDDWYVFYTGGAGTFDVAITDIVDPNEGCCSPFVYLRDRDGNQLSSVSVDEDRIGHIVYTAAGPDRFFLEIGAGAADRYQFRIDPAGLISQVEPAAVSQPCVASQAKLDKLKEKLADAKAAKKVAFGKKAKKKAKKKVKRLKKKVKRAKKSVAQSC